MDMYAMKQLVEEMPETDQERFYEMSGRYMEHYPKMRADFITWGQLHAYKYPDDELTWEFEE